MMFEPMLGFNCEHSFYSVGSPIIQWVSNGSQSVPPKGAPVFQRQKCLNCSGERVVCVGSHDQQG